MPIFLQLISDFMVNLPYRTERDVSAWSQDVLNELLLRVRVENEDGVCQITDVSEIEGEASINNRKGKLIFFYEWIIKASWTGTFTLLHSGEGFCYLTAI